METRNSKDTRTTFYCIYCKLRAYFISFSSVFAVDFEQENVSWVTFYQVINPEITYSRNYQQMYKKITEIEVLKKSVWSKVVSPRKYFSLQVTVYSRSEKIFSGFSVSLFHKSSCGRSFLNRYGIFQRSTCSHILCICNVFDRFWKGIFNFSCRHLFD